MNNQKPCSTILCSQSSMMKIKLLIPKVSIEFKFVSVTNLNKYFTLYLIQNCSAW